MQRGVKNRPLASPLRRPWIPWIPCGARVDGPWRASSVLRAQTGNSGCPLRLGSGPVPQHQPAASVASRPCSWITNTLGARCGLPSPRAAATLDHWLICSPPDGCYRTLSYRQGHPVISQSAHRNTRSSSRRAAIHGCHSSSLQSDRHQCVRQAHLVCGEPRSEPTSDVSSARNL